MTAATRSPDSGPHIELGLRQNAAQFTLLVVVNALVGGMLGQERTVLPLLGQDEFGITAYTAGLSFILAFGIAKAATNYFAGTWSDRFGRKPVLVRYPCPSCSSGHRRGPGSSSPTCCWGSDEA